MESKYWAIIANTGSPSVVEPGSTSAPGPLEQVRTAVLRVRAYSVVALFKYPLRSPTAASDNTAPGGRVLSVFARKVSLL